MFSGKTILSLLKFLKPKRLNTIVPEKKVDDDSAEIDGLLMVKEFKKVGDDSLDIHRFMVKEPGPYDSLKYCIFTRKEDSSSFYLYEHPNPYSTSLEKGKLLLAARKFRHPSHIEYVMSVDPDDFSKESDSYVGKLSSDYLGINFTLYEYEVLPEPDDDDAVSTKQIRPILVKNSKVGQIRYEFDGLKSEGPRNMVQSIRCPPGFGSGKTEALRNRTLKWNEDLECLCFEMKYQITYKKHFHKYRKLGKKEEENIRLRAWSVGDATSILAYRYPCSAFQTFASYISMLPIAYNITIRT